METDHLCTMWMVVTDKCPRMNFLGCFYDVNKLRHFVFEYDLLPPSPALFCVNEPDNEEDGGNNGGGNNNHGGGGEE
eukprot:5040084-Ditylum_brightwellii.AAC.1